MNISNLVAMFNTAEMSLSEKGIISSKVVLTGFVVVFAMLLLLILIIKIYSTIVSKALNSGKKKEKVKVDAPLPVAQKKSVAPPPVAVESEGISDEVVAVISAAVATMYGSSEKAKIKSIKKSGDRSAWANAGVIDNTRPF